MSQEAKTISIISIITILVVVGGLYFWNKSSNLVKDATTTPAVVDRNKVVAPDSHVLGDINAKVIVTEFGDYECPACGIAYPATQQLIAKYKDNKDVAFIFRNYPLPQHRNAMKSAQYAEAAALQGKFWEMHDALYEGQKEWSVSLNADAEFVAIAKKLGLDIDKLEKDVKSPEVAARINADKKAGDEIRVNATPTFFVNGIVQKSWGVNELSIAIDKELAK